MSRFEYPEYEAHRDQVDTSLAKIQDVYDKLSKMMKEWDALSVHAEGGDGDVKLDVNHASQLMALSLAPGFTTRYTPDGATTVINETLAAAVAVAAKEKAAVTGDQGDLQAEMDDFVGPRP